MPKQREEVVNVELARLLSQSGLVAAPEQILGSSKGRRLPDVIVSYRGLRVAIEGKYATNKAAQDKCEQQVVQRLEQGIAHIAIGVLYPMELAACDFSKLARVLRASNLRIQIRTESQTSSWFETDFNGLSEQLRHAYDALVREDVVDSAVAILQEGMDAYTAALAAITTSPGRLAVILGIPEPDNGTK